MARRRYISTDISTDKRIVLLAQQAGDFAALLYTWMVPHADEDGGLTDDYEEVRMKVVPGFKKKPEQISKALDAMIELGLIEREEGRLFFPCQSFYKYQSYIKENARRRQMPENAGENILPPKVPENATSVPISVPVPIPVSISVSVSPEGESASADAEDGPLPFEPPQRVRHVTEEDIEALQGQFPTVNVRGEWLKAQDWLRANRKRKADYVAYLRNWLRKAAVDGARLQAAGRHVVNGNSGSNDDLIAGWEAVAADTTGQGVRYPPRPRG